MIPQKLTLSGFLSYQQPVELDFSTFDIACISGSNGAGKSSLLDGITWVLFGKARHRDDNLLINSHCNTAEVSLEFQYEGNLYRIIRSKSRDKPVRLEFQIFDENWKTLTESTLRETEASIIRTLRMDYDTFINASFFLQGKADQFSQQKPGDRKKILGSILGLEIWETYRETAAEMRRRRENELAGVDRTIAEIDAELSEEGERSRRLKEIEESLAQAGALRKSKEKLVETIRKQFQAVQEQQRMTGLLGDQFRQAENRLKQLQSQLNTRLSEKNAYDQKIAAAAEIENAYHNWLTMRSDLEKWEKLAESFRQVDAKRQAPRITIEKERSRLEQEAATLRQRQTQMNELQKQLPSIQAALNNLERDIAAVREKISLKGSLEANIRGLQDERARLAAENKNLNAEMKVLKDRQNRLREADSPQCPLCGQELTALHRQELLDSLQAEGDEKGMLFRQNLEIARQIDESVIQVEAELRSIQQLDHLSQQKTRQLDQGSEQKKVLEAQLQHWSAVEGVRFQEIRRLLEEEDYALEARRELEEINQSLLDLGYNASAHDKARQAEQEGHASQEKYRALENARAALVPLQGEIARLTQQLQDEEKSFGELQLSYTAAREKLESYQKDLPDLQLEELELRDLLEKENRLRMDLGGALQRVKVLDDLRGRRNVKTAQREQISRLIGQIKMLERAYGKDGVPALLIEQALPEIEIQANEILSRLTAGRMGIRFLTQKDYRDRKREDKKETLDILISDAAGVREYDLFSGGEAFRVNFALRLALSRVLAKRAGARLQTLVIDEGFGSQDAEGLQRLIESINIVRTDFAKVLVISHLEEMKDTFPARIEVEKDLHGSTLRVIQ